MLFISDNATGVCLEIMDAMIAANSGTTVGYGDDAMTQRMRQAFDDHFETNVHVFPAATGTAINAIAVSSICPPWGAVYCHEDSHLAVDECGAPELYTGGAKLITLSGAHAKLSPADIEAALSRYTSGNPHAVQPAVVSVTQITEYGAAYTLDEIRAFADVAHRHGLLLHMDGARFANAVAALGCTPAEMTWRAGVDVLSYGATKNGAMMAEAVVFFREESAKDCIYRQKRGGHLFSKMRFVAAQFEAYLAKDVWRKNAAHANAMARRLADGLTALPGITLEHPLDANLVFVRLSDTVRENLRSNGYGAYSDYPVIRLAMSFNTTQEEVDAFIAACVR